jgi:hypothetical protein
VNAGVDVEYVLRPTCGQERIGRAFGRAPFAATNAAFHVASSEVRTCGRKFPLHPRGNPVKARQLGRHTRGARTRHRVQQWTWDIVVVPVSLRSARYRMVSAIVIKMTIADPIRATHWGDSIAPESDVVK